MTSPAPSPLIPDPTCLHLVHLGASSSTIIVVVRQTLRKRVLCCAEPLVGEKLVSLTDENGGAIH